MAQEGGSRSEAQQRPPLADVAAAPCELEAVGPQGPALLRPRVVGLTSGRLLHVPADKPFRERGKLDTEPRGCAKGEEGSIPLQPDIKNAPKVYCISIY